MEYGWICPRCNVVNAPHMDMCKNCLPENKQPNKFSLDDRSSLKVTANCDSGTAPLHDNSTLVWDTKGYSVLNKDNNLCDQADFSMIVQWSCKEDNSIVIQGVNALHVLHFNNWTDQEVFSNVLQSNVKRGKSS